MPRRGIVLGLGVVVEREPFNRQRARLVVAGIEKVLCSGHFRTRNFRAEELHIRVDLMNCFRNCVVNLRVLLYCDSVFKIRLVQHVPKVHL